MRKLLHTAATLVLFGIIHACTHDAPITVEDSAEELPPEMATYDVSMLVSDSGIIRYRVSTDVWLRYHPDSGEEYQYFPEGIFLEQIDSLFQPTASVVADTAYNYETRQLWHLIRNVHIVNQEGEHFYTHDLFYDMRRHKVYSDSFIRIVRPNATLTGYGFTSDDRFTEYVVHQTAGDFPMNAATRRDTM